MRVHTVLTLAACFALATACSDFMSGSEPGDASGKKRTHYSRTVAAPKPTVSPAAQKTCTETFNLEVGTPRYDKCIASLAELEAK